MSKNKGEKNSKEFEHIPFLKSLLWNVNEMMYLNADDSDYNQ